MTKQMTPIYAGVGSRETPPHVLKAMEHIARALALDGWLLRTGGARGADQAFEIGCLACQRQPIPMEIWVPWAGYNGYAGNGLGDRSYSLGGAAAEIAETIAADLHPAWHRCGRGARRLHARNAFIMLGGEVGSDDEQPVDAVVCWTRTGGPDGGTGMAIRIAEARGIPVVNLKRVGNTDDALAAVRQAAGRDR